MTVRRLAAIAALGAMAAAATLTAGRAHADPTDDAVYLAVLHVDGLQSSYGDGALLTAGRAVCTAFAQGATFEDVVAALDRGNPLLPVGGAGIVIGAATANFCPQYPPAETGPQLLHEAI